MMKILFKLLLFLIFYNLFLINCEDIIIWDNEERSQTGSWLTITKRHTTDMGLLMQIFSANKQLKHLPMCSMVGCATNATQCVGYGGKEMVNKLPMGDFNQAYFKSVLTLDKTHLSINCNKLLVPCCFAKTVNDKNLPMFPSVPSMNVTSNPGFIQTLSSLFPKLPPMNVYVLSNVCLGAGIISGKIDCNYETE